MMGRDDAGVGPARFSSLQVTSEPEIPGKHRILKERLAPLTTVQDNLESKLRVSKS